MIYFQNLHQRRGCMMPAATSATTLQTNSDRNYSASYVPNQTTKLSRYTQPVICVTTVSGYLSGFLMETDGRSSTNNSGRCRIACRNNWKSRKNSTTNRRFTAGRCKLLTFNRQPKNLTGLNGTSGRFGKCTRQIFQCSRSAQKQR